MGGLGVKIQHFPLTLLVVTTEVMAKNNITAVYYEFTWQDFHRDFTDFGTIFSEKMKMVNSMS